MCGIFGIYSNISDKNLISQVINGLKLLQHRGKDGCGISYITSGSNLKLFKTLGKVEDGFKNYKKNKRKTLYLYWTCAIFNVGQNSRK